MVVLRSTVAHIGDTNIGYIICIIAGTSIVVGVQRLSRGTTIPISLSDDLSSHFTSYHCHHCQRNLSSFLCRPWPLLGSLYTTSWSGKEGGLRYGLRWTLTSCLRDPRSCHDVTEPFLAAVFQRTLRRFWCSQNFLNDQY